MKPTTEQPRFFCTQCSTFYPDASDHGCPQLYSNYTMSTEQPDGNEKKWTYSRGENAKLRIYHPSGKRAKPQEIVDQLNELDRLKAETNRKSTEKTEVSVGCAQQLSQEKDAPIFFEKDVKDLLQKWDTDICSIGYVTEQLNNIARLHSAGLQKRVSELEQQIAKSDKSEHDQFQGLQKALDKLKQEEHEWIMFSKEIRKEIWDKNATIARLEAVIEKLESESKRG